MLFESREVRPGPTQRQVVNEYGIVESIPHGWDLLPPGDAALSRRIKLDGPSVTVIELRGRKRFSRGIWAPADRIAALRGERAAELQDPAHQKSLEAGRRRRAAEQEVYAEEFRGAVLRHLDFHGEYEADAAVLAGLIAAHAVPVGSGTVARTQRIPIEERARAATTAWLRHQTTAYDEMAIARVRGRRREVRRRLAHDSGQLLAQYRRGLPVDRASCPLQAALRRASGRL
jgi:hypothetical protein